jgi:hypothetical protein
VNDIFLENPLAVLIDARICLSVPLQTSKSMQQELTTMPKEAKFLSS